MKFFDAISISINWFKTCKYMAQEWLKTTLWEYTWDKNENGLPHWKWQMTYQDGRIYIWERKNWKRHWHWIVVYPNWNKQEYRRRNWHPFWLWIYCRLFRKLTWNMFKLAEKTNWRIFKISWWKKAEKLYYQNKSLPTENWEVKIIRKIITVNNKDNTENLNKKL